MKNKTGAMLALVLTMGGDIAVAKPTPEEVAEARADCRRNRERVEQLESEYPSADVSRELGFARSKWEHSCAYAESLMQDAGMEPPSAPIRAPLPPQEIRIIERRPAPPRETPAQVGGTPRRDAPAEATPTP